MLIHVIFIYSDDIQLVSKSSIIKSVGKLIYF